MERWNVDIHRCRRHRPALRAARRRAPARLPARRSGRPASYLDSLGGLDRTRTLLLLDPRGVGRSAPAGSYAFTDLADDLEALRVHLGLEQLDLLGHSAGAWPVVQYAGRYPGRVRRLVILTPSRLPIPPQPGEVDRATLAERWFGAEPWFEPAMQAYRSIDAGMPHADLEARLLAAAPLFYGGWDEAMSAHAARPGDSESVPEARDGFWATEFAPSGLDRLGAPVAVLAGDRDIVTGEAAPVVLAGWFPRGSLTWLTGCGHFPWYQDPVGVTDTIEAALGAAPGKPAGPPS